MAVEDWVKEEMRIRGVLGNAIKGKSSKMRIVIR